MGFVLKLKRFFLREIDEYDPETKRQSREWKSYGSPRSIKARKSKSKVKAVLIVFFNMQGIIHFEFFPQGQKVNQTVYKEILRRFVRSVCEKRQSLWEPHAWALHYDNAPAHTALSIRQFLAEKNISTLEQTSYFPNLAPCDFLLFPKIKSVLKGTHFSDIDFIKMAAPTELKKFQKMASKNVLNCWKSECTSVFKWKGIALKEFDFGIFQYFLTKIL